MRHFFVVAVSIIALILLTKFAFDWLERRRERRHLNDVILRLQFLESQSDPLQAQKDEPSAHENVGKGSTRGK